jgi:hypothetical protein
MSKFLSHAEERRRTRRALKIHFGETYWVEVADVMKHVAFSTAADADATLDRQMQIVYTDGGGAQAEPALVSVDVIAPTAPLLDTTLSPALRPTREDALTPASTQVASLLKGAVTDLDAGALRGIAVTHAAASHGKWQYSLQKGQWLEMGSPSRRRRCSCPVGLDCGSCRTRISAAPSICGTVLGIRPKGQLAARSTRSGASAACRASAPRWKPAHSPWCRSTMPRCSTTRSAQR